jgi:hypothetical protein
MISYDRSLTSTRIVAIYGLLFLFHDAGSLIEWRPCQNLLVSCSFTQMREVFLSTNHPLVWNVKTNARLLVSPSSKTRRWMSDEPSDTTVGVPLEKLDDIKAELIQLCAKDPKTPIDKIIETVALLEDIAERKGIGQASSISGLLAGEWELLYAADDVTRSSPFFTAFRQAFPDQADQIYVITDSIPSPFKEVGPASQMIDLNVAAQTGKLVSRVKVATLGGSATSVMTTISSIIGFDSLDGLRVKVETTMPEESSIISMLFGPLTKVLYQNLPPFPSGEALERVSPGSSVLTLRTTFCDEGLRVSRYESTTSADSKILIWRRVAFSAFDSM